MMISEPRRSESVAEPGWERPAPAGPAALLLQAEPRRAPRSLRAVLSRLVGRVTPQRRDDVGWVGDSMLRTTESLAVYVFQGEATPATTSIVTRRGPGRDRLLGGTATGVGAADWAYAVHADDRPRHRAPSRSPSCARGCRSASSSGSSASTERALGEEHLCPRWERGRLLVDGSSSTSPPARLTRIDAEQARRRLEAVMRPAETFVWVAEVDADGGMHEHLQRRRHPADPRRHPCRAARLRRPHWRNIVHAG